MRAMQIIHWFPYSIDAGSEPARSSYASEISPLIYGGHRQNYSKITKASQKRILYAFTASTRSTLSLFHSEDIPQLWGFSLQPLISPRGRASRAGEDKLIVALFPSRSIISVQWDFAPFIESYWANIPPEEHFLSSRWKVCFPQKERRWSNIAITDYIQEGRIWSAKEIAHKNGIKQK